MINKVVSANNIIAGVYRDFKPSNSNWVFDAIEWIGDALQAIGCHSGYVQDSEKGEVEQYRCHLPCHLDYLLFVEYKGRRLPVRNTNYVLNQKCKLPDSIEAYCSLAPNLLLTSFETGCITFHFEKLQLDVDGFPMIPDNYYVKESIKWYIISKMLGRGMKHQTFTFKDAYSEWNRLLPMATNDSNFPSIEEMETFKNRWSSIHPSINAIDTLFENNKIERNIKETGTQTFM